MQSLSKQNLVDKLQFVEAQSVFILETTAKVIFATIKTRLHPLLDDVHQILIDINVGLRDDVVEYASRQERQ